MLVGSAKRHGNGRGALKLASSSQHPLSLALKLNRLPAMSGCHILDALPDCRLASQKVARLAEIPIVLGCVDLTRGESFWVISKELESLRTAGSRILQ